MHNDSMFCERISDGLTVRLFWNPRDLENEFTVTVFDSRDGTDFTLFPLTGRDAMTAYHHPFGAMAYALNGKRQVAA